MWFGVGTTCTLAIELSGGDREQQQVVLRGLPLRELAEQLGVIALREVDRLESFLDVADRRPEVALVDVGTDRDQAGEVLVLDVVRRRDDLHAGDRAQRRRSRTAAGCSARTAAPRTRRAARGDSPAGSRSP